MIVHCSDSSLQSFLECGTRPAGLRGGGVRGAMPDMKAFLPFNSRMPLLLPENQLNLTVGPMSFVMPCLNKLIIY